jgi:hypothetical protein
MDVVLQVAAETVDPLTQHGHLDLGRTGVGAVGLVGVDQLLLLGCIELVYLLPNTSSYLPAIIDRADQLLLSIAPRGVYKLI